MSAALLEKLNTLLEWSFKLSTIEDNTAKLSTILGDINKHHNGSSKREDLHDNTEYGGLCRALNTHLIYMVSRPDIHAAPDEFRTSLMAAHDGDLLADSTRVVIAKELPEVAMSIILDDITTLSKSATIAIECGVLYPEFMIDNLSAMKTLPCLMALVRLLRGSGDSRNHEIPHVVETAAAKILSHLRSLNLENQIEYETWANCITPLVGILASDDMDNHDYKTRLLTEVSWYADNKREMWTKYSQVIERKLPRVSFK
jgi:hypothetical protein